MEDIKQFSSTTGSVDTIREYFGKIYNYMAGGLTVSGIVAYLSANGPLAQLFYTVSDGILSLSVLGWIAVIAPLILIFMFNSAVSSLNVSKANALFWVFSVLMGVSLSSVFLVYTSSSIVQAFLVTAGSFFALSLYGYSTKRDLSTIGKFLIFALFGVIIASILTIFFPSSTVTFGLNIACVVIFGGLMAYDTQKLKQLYYSTNDENTRKAAAISGALSLYLDFINLFRAIIELTGERK